MGFPNDTSCTGSEGREIVKGKGPLAARQTEIDPAPRVGTAEGDSNDGLIHSLRRDGPPATGPEGAATTGLIPSDRPLISPGG